MTQEKQTKKKYTKQHFATCCFGNRRGKPGSYTSGQEYEKCQKRKDAGGSRGWRCDGQRAEKGKKREERGRPNKEKWGNYCPAKGIHSNFLLLKKPFIYVDSLLVMYSSVNPHHIHSHPLPSPCVYILYVSPLSGCVSIACLSRMRLYCFSCREREH